MAASSIPLQFDFIRNPLLGNRSFLLRRAPSIRTVTTPSAKFNLYEMMGGRGICNGEKGIGKELERPIIGEQESLSLAQDSPLPSSSDIGGEDGFEKELLGLTGGFPGGERGLQRFIEKNPPLVTKNPLPVQGSRPKAPELPLFMPGMIVIVKNPENPFYMYSGIVQRVTDGKAGVLFEGGNWDKLLTFKLHELERREKGPPMVNPKSAIHEVVFDTKVE